MDELFLERPCSPTPHCVATYDLLSARPMELPVSTTIDPMGVFLTYEALAIASSSLFLSISSSLWISLISRVFSSLSFVFSTDTALAACCTSALACTPNLSHFCSFDSSSCRYCFRRARERRWLSRTRAGSGLNWECKPELPDAGAFGNILVKRLDLAMLKVDVIYGYDLVSISCQALFGGTSADGYTLD